MNKNTREELKSYRDQLENLVELVRSLADQEREKYYNAPDNLVGSDRVQAYFDCADAIDWVCDEIHDALDELDYEVLNVY